jgi:putative Mg2+ transporter-C (MgtC) family protein
MLNTLETVIRLAAALAAGGLIGAQREMVHSSAGFRTHTLVCMGSCLAMLANQFLFDQYHTYSTMDVARMGSYVLGGIGFLGAGTIVKDGLRVRGLTTAASLWVVAAVGLAIGCGFYLGGLLACVFTVLALWGLKFIEDKSFGKSGTVSVEMEMRNTPGQLAAILAPLVELGCSVKAVHVERGDEEWVGLSIRLKLPRGVDYQQTSQRIRAVEGVRM